jgi:hypothetical protein
MRVNKDIRFMSWNVLDSLNDPQVQTAIIDGAPDIGVFSEAAHADVGVSTETRRRFENSGYEFYDVPYSDGDGRQIGASGRGAGTPGRSQCVAGSTQLG